MVQLHGYETDAYGNGFRYEITDSEGEEFSEYSELQMGSYLLKAVHRTYSAIQSAAQEINVSAFVTDSLTEIIEDQKLTLSPSGSEQFFRFTPQQSATYFMDSDLGLNWNVYQNTEYGLMQTGKNLTADQEYIIQIYKVSQKCQMTLSAKKENLTLDNAVTFSMAANGRKAFTFTPEEAGKYSVQVKHTGDNQTALDLTVNGWDGGYNNSGLNQTSLYGWVEEGMEGTECEIVVATENTKDSSYEIVVTRCGKVSEIQVGVKSTEHYHSDVATVGDLYNLNDLFDVVLVYEDGSAASVEFFEEDIYGNYVDGWYETCVERIKDRVTWNFAVSAGGVTEYVPVIFDNSTVEIKELKPGDTDTIEPDENGWSYYLYKPEETGYYAIDLTDYSNCEVYRVSRFNGWNTHYDSSAQRIYGGDEWIIAIHTCDESGEVPNQLSFYEKKEITDLELVSSADPFLIRCEQAGKGMTAKATYKDGTTAIINAADYVDSYGNEISCSYRILSSNKARVYMYCGGYQVYCDVNGKAVEDLQELKTKQYTTFELSGDKNNYTQVFARFTPEESGTYQAVLDFDGVLGSDLMIYDTATGEAEVLPADMEAGETYVIGVRLYSESGKSAGIRPIRVDVDDLCADGHTLLVQSDVAATCTTDGVKVSVCADCGKTVKERTAALGHDLDTGVVSKEATCIQAGLMTYNCKTCKAVVQKVIAKKEHNWNKTATVDVEATCTTTGSQSIHCADCGAVQENSKTEIEMLEHSWNTEYTIDADATCTLDGSKSVHCSVCDAVNEASVTVIEATDHKLSETGIVTKAATCETDGILCRECLICHEDVESVIEATGHDFHEEDWIMQIDPTCTGTGLAVRVCRNCNKTENDIKPANGHTFDKSEDPIVKESTATEQGKVYYPCSVDECDGEEVVKVLLVTTEQEKLDSVAESVNNLTEEGTETDPLTLVSSVTEFDNQELIDTASMDVVTTLDTNIVAAENQISETVVSQTVTEDEVVNVSGAAVTVAAELQDANNNLDENETYYAEISVEDYEPAAYALRTMALDDEEEAGVRETSHTVYISMSIRNSQKTEVLNDVTPKAPLQITLPVPEIFLDGSRFTLTCMTSDGATVAITYTLSADGKSVTFSTPVLGYFQFILSQCADGTHVPAESYTDSDIITSATCTVAGRRKGVCTICSAEIQVAIDPLGHEYDQNDTPEEGSTAATCTEAGTAVYSCTRDNCNEQIAVNLPALGHTWTEDVSRAMKATCTEPGQKVYTCSCLAEKTVTIDPISRSGHTWEEIEVIEPATCVDNGVTAVQCVTCDATDVKIIPAKGHNFNSGRITKSPTCADSGIRTYICMEENCEFEKEVEIPVSTSHTWKRSATTDKEPNCAESGSESIYCFICDQKQEGSDKEIPATGAHVWDAGTVTKEPTCTEDGVKVFHCTKCQSGVKQEAVSKAENGHVYRDAFTTDVQPTCTTAGSKSRHCTNCSAVTDVTAVPATGHTWKTVVDQNPTCGKAGSQHRECTVCGTKEAATSINATGKHSFTNYTVKQAATALKEGLEVGTCSVCGQTDNRVMSKLPGTIKAVSKKVPLQVKKSVALKNLVTGLAEGDSVASGKSSNTKVATIKNGKVTAKAAGSTKVTITLKSGVSTTVTVNVQKPAVKTTGITVSSKKVTLQVGKSTSIVPVVTPVTSLEKVTYKSSNKKIVTVNSKGKITAKASGKATITVKSGKKSVKVTVTVPKIAPTKITGVPASKNLKKGKTLTLKPKLSPKGAEATIKYSTSNKKVATVDKKGKVKAVGKGTAVITVTAGKIKAQCKITVK